MELSQISKVELRDYWKNEASDFTPWLAKEENIALLGQTIGIKGLEVVGTEQPVGPFRADIFCIDSENGNSVLIENQLEKTDHSHLGQIMTYASGLDSATIIWIASLFTEEHRSTIDWLNRITSSEYNFFGIEISLIKIDNSKAAPLFTVVAKPNGWSKSIHRAISSRRPNLNFIEMEIPIGSKIEFIEDRTKFAIIDSDRHINMNGEIMSLTKATKILLHKDYTINPCAYWVYEGKVLSDIYDKTYSI